MFIAFSDPFEVAFVATTYTVDESVGAVNVCVHLTQPQTSILDETVSVLIIDNSSSVYIPAGAALASESNIVRFKNQQLKPWYQYFCKFFLVFLIIVHLVN